MTNLNIAKLYLANNTNATAAQIDTAVTDGTALTAINALTTAQFVEAAYQAAFGRAADAEGLAYWSDKIDNQGMAADDAFMTALNYGATVYVAPTVDAPLVIGGVTFTAATVSATDDVVVAAAKATAEAAASSASVGSVAAAVVDVVDATTAAAAAVVIDAADAAADAAAAASAPDASETFVLTTSSDPITGGTGNDTINGSVVDTLTAGDIILDATTTDADVLNATIKAGLAITPTITKIETINLDFDVLSGAAFNAVNVTGATINADLVKFGNDGALTVSNTKSNNVVAGTDVKALTVTGLTQGSVDTGSALTAAITGGTTSTTNVAVNGDIVVTATTLDKLALDVTKAATVTVTEVATSVTTVTVTGSDDVTIKQSAADVDGSTLVNSLTGSELTLAVTGANATVDATLIQADLITLTSDLGTSTLSVASGQEATIGINQTALTVDTTATTATTALINVGTNLADIDLTDSDLTATLNITAATTIAKLTSASTNTVKIIGSEAITIAADTASAGTMDASGLSGAFTYTSIDQAYATEILGGTSSNTIVIANTVDTVVYTGQSGVDTIDATAFLGKTGVTNDKIIVQSGAGKDKLMLDADKLVTTATNDGTIIFNGGTEDDTLSITGTAGAITLANTLFNLDSVETIKVEVAGVNLTFNGESLDGVATNILGIDDAATATTLAVTGALAKEQTIDLSGITTTNISTITITAEDAQINHITGTSVDDIIISGSGQDNLTGGAGKDTFTIATTDSSEATMDKISDFKLTDDKLDIAQVGLTAVATAVDVSAAVAGATELEVVISATGKIGLAGASTSMVDTIGEFMDIIGYDATTAGTVSDVLADNQAAFFELDGNTYVVVNEASAVPADVYDIVELTGVTGIENLSTVAGSADTIFIA